MRERYSPERYKKAEKESLEPAEAKKLQELRDIEARWHKVRNAKTPGYLGAALDAWNEFRESLRPSTIRHTIYEVGQRDEALKEAHSRTKEGQMEMAQGEASFFNEAYDIRAERLRQAGDNRANAPEEYEAALASFNELVKDLNESDLVKYQNQIDRKMSDKEIWGASEPSDIQLENEEDVEVERQDIRREIESTRKHADDMERRFDEIAEGRAEHGYSERRGKKSEDPAKRLEIERQELRAEIDGWRRHADDFEQNIERISRARASGGYRERMRNRGE